MWYAAHLVMQVKLKTGTQRNFTVTENIVLIEAATPEEAEQKALSCASFYSGDSNGSFTWDDVPAEWVFLGIRKINTVIAIPPNNQVVSSENEVSYNCFNFSSQIEVKKFMSCGVARTVVTE